MKHSSYVFFKERDGKDVDRKVMKAFDFERIEGDIDLVSSVSRCEELYHMIVTALLEFNVLPIKRVELCRYADFDELNSDLYRIECNRCAASFLTILKMYREYVSPEEKGARSLFGVSKRLFEKKEFRFCNGLRNFIQHVDCFPITLSNDGRYLACREMLRTSHVTIPVENLLKKCFRATKGTRADLELLASEMKEVDLSQIFQMVMDLVDEVHRVVRSSSRASDEFESAKIRLKSIEAEYLAKGFWMYRYDGDDKYQCRGTMPYLASRQLRRVAYFRKIYKCKGGNAKVYTTSLPSDLIKRLAVADEDVEGYVRNNGVVASFEREKRIVTSTKYTTREMRKWYLKKE